MNTTEKETPFSEKTIKFRSYIIYWSFQPSLTTIKRMTLISFTLSILRRSRPVIIRRPHHRAHSPNFPSLHLLDSSFSNPSVALPTSQLILQPFRCFAYVTADSPTLLSLLLRHRLFTYVTWRVAHDIN